MDDVKVNEDGENPTGLGKVITERPGEKQEATCGKLVQSDRERGPELGVIRQKNLACWKVQRKDSKVLRNSEEESDEWMCP